MPAIGSNLDNFKEKVPYKIQEYLYQNECGDEKEKEWNEQDQEETDEPMILLQPPPSGSKMVPVVLVCILGIWMTLTFWLVVCPTQNQYARTLCSQLLYDSSSSPTLKEEIMQKLGKQLQQFNELSALYGKYFNASSKDVLKAMQDPFLWYIFFSIIVDGDINEIDMSSDSWGKFIDSGLSDRMQNHFERVTSRGVNCKKVKKVYNSINTQRKTIMASPAEPTHAELISNYTTNQRLSDNKMIILYDDVATGAQFVKISKQNLVTLTTQSSLDHLESFVSSVSEWNGPISLAVFLNGPSEFSLFEAYMDYLNYCHAQIYEKTRFSVVSPLKNPVPKKSLRRSQPFLKSCSSLSVDINEKLKKHTNNSKEWLKANWYPQNTMRNLANYNSLTVYHLTLDIDIKTSAKMSEALDEFFKHKKPIKNALVVPTYEVSKKAKFPSNKAELVTLRRKGLAQPFHKDVFALNQNATNFAKWEKLHDTFDNVSVAHEVPKFHLYYEPFFVEHFTSPLYNESFVGYGFTRSSHAYEMYLKHGNFKVLSPVFTAQLGLQKVKQWSAERQQQNEYNRRLFEQLVKTLNTQFRSNKALEFSISDK